MAELMLRDRRVLVVEDEYFIAQAVERGLRSAGAIVVGPVPNVAKALALIAAEPDLDAAVLDINLGEQRVYPVVDALLARGTRCVFATGNDPADVPPAYARIARCEKPLDPACLVQAVIGSSAPVVPGQDHANPASADDLRQQLLRLIELADRSGNTLVAARLCEVLDIVDL